MIARQGINKERRTVPVPAQLREVFAAICTEQRYLKATTDCGVAMRAAGTYWVLKWSSSKLVVFRPKREQKAGRARYCGLAQTERAIPL